MDIVTNGVSGFTATPYSTNDLADKIKNMVLLPAENRAALGQNGRRHVIQSFHILLF